MSDWSRGYPAHNAYLDTMQPEISPFRWRTALLAARVSMPSTRRFRFLELGCGSAHTLIALAALYPEADFLGVDFTPELVVRARKLIAEVGLSNIRIEEASFAELAAARCPEQFDYAALHGVWTWVDADTQGEIVAVLGKWLAPGGLAYAGYNCMAGWAAAEPIRQIFRSAPQGDPSAPYTAARLATEQYLALNDNLQLRTLWQRLSQMPDRFLAHEIGATWGGACWHPQIEAALGAAKMGFACPSELSEQFDPLFLEGARLEMVTRGTAEGWTQTARDLAYGRSFRNDLFHRGAPRLSGPEMIDGLRRLRVLGWNRDAGFGPLARLTLRDSPVAEPDIEDAIARAVADGPGLIGDIVDALVLDPQRALQAVLVQIIKGNLLVIRTDDEIAAARDGARAFNAVGKAHFDARRHVLPCLASPVLGGVVMLPEKLQKIAYEQRDCDALDLDRLSALELTT
ncbi:class I SAM-dependent methyltransferase [Salipiger sp. 1_MG-2023]|uniref:class I SAM-dependent methyltransferase n=1 Tax=Salipiger sp. 1_MG-2023 TaxID=3062665 RepID=UPI0026E18BE7|nr:class I SAM-dependent methyltransferase [Salipiger sp. 1_MG-2023]MDO6587948.1 class I SAM-dependent methyltransferase [Salipiger sp. 1_MG-2023]